MAYLVECRTSAVDGTFDARRVADQVLESLQRSQILHQPQVALDARTPQLAAVMAANELLWRTNEYCGDDPAAHVKITHLVSQLSGP